MKRTEMYKALEGKKVVCMRDCRIAKVGVFHKGRMAFSITPFKPLKRTDASCTTYFFTKRGLYRGLRQVHIGTQRYS